MRRRVAWGALALVAALVVGMSPAVADGNQTLGTPSVPIASGSGIATGGTGLADTGSGTIDLTVPDGASVAQVLLYWEGQYVAGTGATDDTIVVDGHTVTGTLIGTSEHFPTAAGMVMSDTYRADITGLGVVSAGANSLSVSDVAFGFVTDGAGVVVILDDGSTVATIDVRDGNDGAYALFPEPRRSTVPQTFTFPASTLPRVADIAMLVSSAADQFPGSETRPNLVVFSGGVTTTFYNPFGDLQGNHWDSKVLQVGIPAGATTMTIEVVSPNNGYPSPDADRPASLFWNAAALSIAPPPPAGDGCTLTAGYWQTHSELGPAAYDSTWDAKAGGSAPFFDSGMSYIAVAPGVEQRRERLCDPGAAIHRSRAQRHRRRNRACRGVHCDVECSDAPGQMGDLRRHTEEGPGSGDGDRSGGDPGRLQQRARRSGTLRVTIIGWYRTPRRLAHGASVVREVETVPARGGCWPRASCHRPSERTVPPSSVIPFRPRSRLPSRRSTPPTPVRARACWPTTL